MAPITNFQFCIITPIKLLTFQVKTVLIGQVSLIKNVRVLKSIIMGVIILNFILSCFIKSMIMMKTEESFATPYSSEIMTPYFDNGTYQPFSRVSVAALADLGYLVNMEAADPLYFKQEYYYHSGNETFYRKMKALDEQRPTTTFVLDSSNIIHPEVHVIDYVV
jgi:hypothetical protein